MPAADGRDLEGRVRLAAILVNAGMLDLELLASVERQSA
jgi:hypothetical protein